MTDKEKNSPYVQHILKERLKSLKWNMPFCKVFGKRLFNYWQGNVLGFDILKFDKDINPKQIRSLADFIQNNYGDTGTEVIKGLLA